MADKQYGLILPKSKLAASNVKKPVANVFGDDSSEDEETKAVVSGGTDWMKRKIASGSSVNAKSGATGLGTKIATKHALMKQKALEEDPTVFQYDEVFDQMEADKVEQSGKKKVVDRKPKYIANLLKHAEIRNQEEERRKERKVQKEREAEGDEFADKEKFVTSAYRKKMEEMQKLEEEEQKRQAMEDILDVTKQKDMSGFYRHLYRQTMGEEKGQKSTDVEKEASEEKVEEKADKIKTQKNKPSQRSYRQRRDSEPMEDNSDNENKSGDSSSEGSSDDEKSQEIAKEVTEEDRIEKERLRREELRKQKEKRDRRKKRIAEGRDTSSEEESENENENQNNPNDRVLDEKSKQNEGSNDKENNAPPVAKKPKIDIWKKVTVGQIFDSALERYLIRKSERGSRFPW